MSDHDWEDARRRTGDRAARSPAVAGQGASARRAAQSWWSVALAVTGSSLVLFGLLHSLPASQRTGRGPLPPVGSPADPTTTKARAAGASRAAEPWAMASGEPNSYLVVLDSSQPGPARPLGHSGLLPGTVQSVAVADGYTYVAAYGSGVHVLDVRDPTQPTVVGHAAAARFVHRVAVSEGYAYAAAGSGGLRVLDVADPRHPIEIGADPLEGRALDLAVSGSLAYVVAGRQGLHIVDVSDPTRPTPVGCWCVAHFTNGVALAGDLAYVSAYDTGLHVLDVRDPAHPQAIGTFTPPWNSLGVAVAGPHVYLATEGGGLYRLDVSDPRQPRVVDTSAAARTEAVLSSDGSDLYVADHRCALQAVRTRDGGAPTALGVLNVPGIAAAVAVAAPYVYVATLPVDPLRDCES